MNEREPMSREPTPIDESTYGGSASETGGLYQQDGPTITNPQGDTTSDLEEDESPGPESHIEG